MKTPNISKSKIKPRGIVLHHTAGSFRGSLAWCLDPKSKVSYHSLVDLEGRRCDIAEDTDRVWANGKSTFRGLNDCNSFMLSIAVSEDTNKRILNKEEIETVAMWCLGKMRKWKFDINWITTHREISPGRKNDVDDRAEKAIKDRIKELMR